MWYDQFSLYPHPISSDLFRIIIILLIIIANGCSKSSFLWYIINFSFYFKTSESKFWLHFENGKFHSQKEINQVKVDEDVSQDLIEILIKNGYKKPIEINDTDLAQNDEEVAEDNSRCRLICQYALLFPPIFLFYTFIFNYFGVFEYFSD